MSRISRNPLIMSGLPCIAGTRIPVRAVKNFYRAGYSTAGIIAEYPTLSAEDVEAAIAFGRRKGKAGAKLRVVANG